MKKEIQYRSYPGELRTSGPSLRGYAAVFNSLSADLGGFKEKIAPGAFKRSIEGQADVRALLNHDPNIILGRTTAGTLNLREDAHGLHVIITPPNTQAARDLRESISRGDLNQMSFGFRVRKDDWETRDGEKIRTLIDLDLYDVSPVTFPAYEATNVAARHRSNSMNAELKKLFEERNKLISEQRKLLDSGVSDGDTFDNMETALDEIDDKLQEAKKRETQQRRLDARTLGIDNLSDDTGPIRPMPAEQRNRRKEPPIDSWEPGKTMRFYAPGDYAKREIPAMPEQDRRDLLRYFNVGYAGLTDGEKSRYEQRRSLQMDIDTTGGFLVAPEAFSSKVIAALFDSLWMRQICTNIEMKYAQSFTAPHLASEPDDADFTAELRTGSEDDKTAFEKRSFAPHPMAKRLKISNTLLSRAQNAQEFVMSRLTYKFGVTEEKTFLTGHGAGRPLGIFVASDVGIDSSRDVSTGNSTSELKADNVIETIYSLKSQYRRGASIILHRDVLKQLRKLKTGAGDYLFMPGLTNDRPDTILGLKFYESEFSPNTFTTGQYMFCVGDFSFYWIITALNMTIAVLRELYAETNETGLIGRLEVDGAPVLSEAFARSKLA